MKDKLFQIFFCIYIFWDTALSSILGVRGMDLEGGIIRTVLVGIAGLAWLFYFLYSPKNKEERIMLLLLVLFGVLFYSTRFFNTNCVNFEGYIGQFLRWGADCISGCVIGMILMKQKDYSLIHTILPWECLALTPFMAQACFTMGALEGQMHLEGGLNYQTVAYMMAVFFCISFYYAFIYHDKKKMVIRLVMLIAMLVQAVCCAMAGGRGGLVLLVVYIVYQGYYMLKNRIVSKSRMIGIAVIAVIGFLYIAGQVGLWNSVGFQRSSNGINDDDRTLMWKGIWHFVTDNNYTGYGLGGDYFTFGFYTHNILLDWILELGIVGVLIMLWAFFKTYRKIYGLTHVDSIFMIIMILFIYGFIGNCFSGYWITTNTNWMAFGIAITSANYYQWHTQNNIYQS